MQTGVIRTIDYPAHSPILRYTGEWDDDNRRPNGKGRMQYRNGDILEGEWKNGKKHGRIKYTYANGFVIADYENGKKIRVSNSRDDNNNYSAMAGEVAENVIHNIGKHERWVRSGNEQTDFERYEGEYQNGVPHGHGTLSRSRIRYMPGNPGRVERSGGFRYVGYLKDGRPEGKGRTEYEDGGVYDGEWREGMHHGKGIMTYPGEGRFEGEWREENGYGSMQYTNGDKYDGQWYNGRQNGYGIMTYANGDVYQGQWSHGQRVNGEIRYNDGNVYQGEWENDRPKQ